MADGLIDRLMHGWNAFRGQERTSFYDNGIGSSLRPDRRRMSIGNTKSIVSSLYNRIAIDVAAVEIRHVRLDENERFKEEIRSNLNECLTLSANIDQTSRAFMQDIAISLFDEGVIAVVPVDTSFNPNTTSFDIDTMRVGKIVEWFPQKVKIRVYNDKTGLHEDIMMNKTAVAIIENPLYAVMNEPNSTLQRLIRKLNQLDAVDEQSSSGKLDLIIQLPYVIKSESRKKQAEDRRAAIEAQLKNSKYGIAYTDATERITQLNRPAENNLFTQTQYLTSMLYSQLGLSENVFNGTADEAEMLNYNNRTIEPIVSAITNSMKRTFLTKTARTQGQSIEYFKDPFKLVPVEKIAEIADKFTRNEILTSNEIRGIVGYKPSTDPGAEELRNKNLNQSKNPPKEPVQESTDEKEKEE